MWLQEKKLVNTHKCTYFVDDQGNVWYIGNNHSSNSKKDLGKIVQIQNLTNIKMVSCGYYHTILLDYDGNVFSFGGNDKGQLGYDSNFTESNVPQHIEIPSIDFVVCGESFTICLTIEGLLYSFGDNKGGQLGIGNKKDKYCEPQLISNLFDIVFIDCTFSGYIICKNNKDEFYNWGITEDLISRLCKPTKCDFIDEDIISIKCGYHHIVTLSQNGRVYVFGKNNYGQFGVSNSLGFSKNLKLVDGLPLIKRIESGYHHNMCLDYEDNLWLFGDNLYGQLGTKLKTHQPTKFKEIPNIVDISKGGYTVFIKTIENKIFAFGRNNNGQMLKEPYTPKQFSPVQILKEREEIWGSANFKSRQKSARK